MDHEKEAPIYKAESQQIIGCAMEVLNSLGHGFNEKIYENAMVVEFRLRGIAHEQQRRFDIVYKTEKVGEYIPDLLAYDKIVIDTKVIDQITDREVGQMINYLKITGYHLGYILNFKHPKLEWKRVLI